MLSEQSAATVRATLPAVGAAIGEIADRFYERLFAAHPSCSATSSTAATRLPAPSAGRSRDPSPPSPPTSSSSRTSAPTCC